MRTRFPALSIIILSLIFRPLFGAETHSNSKSERCTLSITIEDFRNNDGTVLLNLFNNPEGFPGGHKVSFIHEHIAIEAGHAVLRLNDIPAGKYALNYIHDEDDSGTLNRNYIGLPKEGFGFSNDIVPKIKLPSFDDASFVILEGHNEITLHVHYL